MRKANSVATQRLAVVLGLIVLLAGTVLAYQKVWHAGYIWDDDVYVTANPLLTAPDGLWRIWFSLDSPSQYFPLVYSAFRLEHALWGFEPTGYHWVNIILHAVNATLLWRLLYKLRCPGAWLGAALWALHPVQVESVAWITELKNVLMGFFFLLTLLCWAQFTEREKGRDWIYYFAALLCYALALLAKTTACTLPAALILILWLKHRPITLRRCLQVLPFVVFAGLMGLLTIWWERYHQGTQGAAFTVGLGDRLLIASRALSFYLAKLVWPAHLCFSYPHWSVSAGNPFDYVWIVVTIVAGGAILLLRRGCGRSVETAFVFFVATLTPVLGFIMLWTFRYSWVADHYQYLACIGPIALFSAGLELGTVRLGRTAHWLGLMIGGVILVALAIRTWEQAGIYADAETLWRATVKCNPSSNLAHNSLGVILGGKQAPIEEEIAEYEKALEGDPNDPEAHNNLGYALQRLGRYEEALAEYEKSVAADPRYSTAHGNLATVLLKLGRSDEAIQQLEKLLAIEPRNAALEHSLGDIMASRNRLDEALAHWRRASELVPNDSSLQATIGRALAARGDLQAALTHLQAAANLSPQDAQAHFNYAAALALLGRYAEAIPEYQQAIALQPDLVKAHVNLAICLLHADRMTDALAAYERAVELRPNDANLHKTLALLLRHLGRDQDAEVHARRAAELESSSVLEPPR